jgi:hypothetical protein
MYAIHVLLSFYIHSLCGPLTGAAAQAVPSAQLLPDGFSAFGNFEVLSTHEDGDEDVVRIRKRANDPEDCDENDCLTYSGWAEEGKVGNSFVDDMQGDFADPLEKRSQLEERSDPKTGTPPCKDIWFDGNPAPGIPIYSLEWPTPSSKIDVRTSSILINSRSLIQYRITRRSTILEILHSQIRSSGFN